MAKCVKDEGGGDIAAALTAIKECYPTAKEKAEKAYAEYEAKRKAENERKEKERLKKMGWFDDPPKKGDKKAYAAYAKKSYGSMLEEKYFRNEDMVKEMTTCLATKNIEYEAYQKARTTCIKKAREKFWSDMDACQER